MKLRLPLIVSLSLFLIGLVAFYVLNIQAFPWFALGGGLALINVLFASWVVKFVLNRLRTNWFVLGLFLLKSLTFLIVIAAVLILLKPMVLPFTLGLGLVIFGSIIAAAIESRHLLKKVSE